MATVAQLTYYPVKGCAGVCVDEAQVTEAGLAHDRTFMVVDADDVFRSQRNAPAMAAIAPHVSAGGSRLELSAPGHGSTAIDVDLSRPRRPVRLFKKTFAGIDQGDGIAAWLSEVLGSASRLMRVPPEHERITSGQTPGTTAYADSSPLLVTSSRSLMLLNEHIAANGADAIPMDRFRANIVVDGWEEPHTEDRADTMLVGDVELGFAKLALRCMVTTLDQATGHRRGHEPLRTLADYRRSGSGVAFGSRFAVLSAGTIAIGDPVAIPVIREPGLPVQ